MIVQSRRSYSSRRSRTTTWASLYSTATDSGSRFTHCVSSAAPADLSNCATRRRYGVDCAVGRLRRAHTLPDSPGKTPTTPFGNTQASRPLGGPSVPKKPLRHGCSQAAIGSPLEGATQPWSIGYVASGAHTTAPNTEGWSRFTRANAPTNAASNKTTSATTTTTVRRRTRRGRCAVISANSACADGRSRRPPSSSIGTGFARCSDSSSAIPNSSSLMAHPLCLCRRCRPVHREAPRTQPEEPAGPESVEPRRRSCCSPLFARFDLCPGRPNT